ncbi:MAG: putative lipid II flippase FtsW [Bacilli bacterium]|nr:putative lipid II flippase FtsW [Bacilli bacterium]
MKEKQLIIFSFLSLSIIGLVMIYSSSYIWALYKYNNQYKFLFNQLIFFILGLFLLLIVYKMDLNIIKRYSNHLLILAIILLGLVLIPGVGIVRNGSRSWFGIASFGIQPSELAKLALIIYTAKYLSLNYSVMKNIKKGLIPILIVIFLFFGLIMLEPDFGSGFILVASIIGMLFIGNTRLSFFTYSALFGMLGISGLVLVAPYRMARIISFLNPWSDPLGTGFQIIQSLYAIGPGGLFGQGFMNSIQKHFYLPEPQTDFIFAIIAEEFGFVGILVIVSLFFIIFYAAMRIAFKEHDLFKKYLVFGLAFNIIFQAFLNLGVVIGLLPVTGVTLPFISYGGSSLIISILEIGLILNISCDLK